MGKRLGGLDGRWDESSGDAPARELRMRRHAAPFGTSLLASTRMGPDTPEPRNSSLVAEKIPKRSLRREMAERAMIVSKKTSRRGVGKNPLDEPKKQRASRGRAPGRAGRGDGEWRTRRGLRDAHLKILHLLGPNAWTWLDASSMEMKRLRASFHLSLSLAVAASGAEAPGAPFWVLPCLPNR